MTNFLKSKSVLIVVFLTSLVLAGGSVLVALRLREKKGVTPKPGEARSIPYGECGDIKDCAPTGCCTQGWCDSGKCVRYEDLGKCGKDEECGDDCQCHPKEKKSEPPPDDKKGVTGTCDQDSQCKESWGGCGDCCDSCLCRDHKCIGWRSNERCRLLFNDQSATCTTDCTCKKGGEGGGGGTAGCYFKKGSEEDVKCDGQAGCPRISVDAESGRVVYTVTTQPNASGGYRICFCDKVQNGCEVDCLPLTRSGNAIERIITRKGFPCGTIQADDNEGFCIWKGPNECSTPPSPPPAEFKCQSISRDPQGEILVGQSVKFTILGTVKGVTPAKAELKIKKPDGNEETLVCSPGSSTCAFEGSGDSYKVETNYIVPSSGKYGACARFCDESGRCSSDW